MSKSKSMWAKGVEILLEKYSIDDYYVTRHMHELSLLALNRFTWTNLPPGMESRHIEKSLFEHGQVAFFERDEGGLLCLPCSPTTSMNVYGDPTGVIVTGIGYGDAKKIDDVVRVLNNDKGIPTSITINYYAQLLAEIDRTSQINLKQQKFPFIIASTKDNELTLKNIFKKMMEGTLDIFVDKKMSNGGDIGIQCINTNVPYVVDKLREEKNDIICEVLTLLGLNNSNANNSKKERLLVDEINVNNGHILMNLDIDYKNRAEACKLINEKFGTNISVEKTIDILSKQYSNINIGKGDEDNG